MAPITTPLISFRCITKYEPPSVGAERLQRSAGLFRDRHYYSDALTLAVICLCFSCGSPMRNRPRCTGRPVPASVGGRTMIGFFMPSQSMENGVANYNASHDQMDCSCRFLSPGSGAEQCEPKATLAGTRNRTPKCATVTGTLHFP